MWNNIIQFKDSKYSWLTLMAIPVFLFGSALFFQHGLGLEPCVLCIYQRIGVIGIFLAALIQLSMGAQTKTIKIITYPLWIASSSFGLWAAARQWYETYMTRENPFFLGQCGKGLEEIFPFIEKSDILSSTFIAKGICTEIDWHFLGLEMHHYMTLFFSCFLLAGIFYMFVSLFQTVKEKK